MSTEPELEPSARVQRLRHALMAAAPGVCAERAVLVTEFFKARADRRRPVVQNKAAALAHVLARMTLRIAPDELLVGCFSSHRVGGSLYPELHGVAMLEDLLRFERREVNPLRIRARDRWRLGAYVAPYWATRFLALRAFPLRRALHYFAEQTHASAYLINEAGGIAHLIPDYETLVSRGTQGLRAQAHRVAARLPAGDAGLDFLAAVEIACAGLEAYAARCAAEAERLAGAEPDPARRHELEAIAAHCRRVPREPARTFAEALQAILFAQIALNLESLDNGISPGRLDQILWPAYEADLRAARLTRAGAFELLCCFTLKLCELVPVFSARLTRYHGGLMSGQAVIVGGTTRSGADAANELSLLFLDVMDKLRVRQPNYHARIGRASSAAYRRKIAATLARGATSPAIFNDELIVPALRAHGCSEEDARDYATIGCVEPGIPGKSFLSTDAALFNLPLCLELALNRGRRFGRRRRAGAPTPAAAACRDTAELFALFRRQLDHLVARLLADLAAIEAANAAHHPTPLTSALVGGCIDQARDVTQGGAIYNGSGIQGVGAVEVGESLAAIEHVIFERKAATLGEVVAALGRDFAGAAGLREQLRAAPKFGNDDARADVWVAQVIEAFAASLGSRRNARGGAYVPGFYSMTCHEAFGAMVGAMPSGRGAGEPFASGLSASSGMDRRGPTAALCSVAGLPLGLAVNGVNVNLKLAPWTVAGAQGERRLQALIDGAVGAGIMQVQFNVLDPKVLIEARDHPGRHPGLLVRVSGYSAYFDDLSPAMKHEVIERTLAEAG